MHYATTSFTLETAMIIKYRVLRHASDDDVKYSPQEEVVRDAIFSLANIGESVDRERVISRIENEGKLSESRQPVSRIVNTYQRMLVLRGLIDVEKESQPKGLKSDHCPHCHQLVYIFRGKLLAAMPEIEETVDKIVDEVEAEVA